MADRERAGSTGASALPLSSSDPRRISPWILGEMAVWVMSVVIAVAITQIDRPSGKIVQNADVSFAVGANLNSTSNCASSRL